MQVLKRTLVYKLTGYLNLILAWGYVIRIACHANQEIDARPPRLSSRPACHHLSLHTPQTPACVAGGGQAPGALHHIIARGIERKRIFTDGVDRDNFLNRLGKL